MILNVFTELTLQKELVKLSNQRKYLTLHVLVNEISVFQHYKISSTTPGILSTTQKHFDWADCSIIIIVGFLKEIYCSLFGRTLKIGRKRMGRLMMMKMTIMMILMKIH